MKTVDICVIICAGGQGTRMKEETPKQFLMLKEKPIVNYSFEILATLPGVVEIVVVCEPEYRELIQLNTPSVQLTFAPPGERRQDSVYNGLAAMTTDPVLICIHDAARPLISLDLVKRVIEAGEKHGAATVGMPIKFTIKESDENEFVTHTPDRSKIWEIQTPQVMRTELLRKGFEIAREQNLTVTDDVSLVELLKHPVKLVKGSHSNLKLTTPEDYNIMQQLLAKQHQKKKTN